jgi:two-component system response regulator PilR (NtrC family)
VPAAAEPDEAPHPAARSLDSQVEEVERAQIQKALEQARYNKTRAARLLGITLDTLRYRIKKLGIS